MSHGWFHVVLAGVLFLCVVLGFSPTFFLRPVFTDRPLPVYLYVHGLVLTVWFTLSFAQSYLVVTRRVALHRRLGVAGAVVAAALVPLSALVAIRAIPRYRAAGVAAEEIQFIVLGDLISLAVFSGLVACGIAWRRQREWHRRFMTVASIMIVGPAVARLDRIGFAVPVPLVLVLLLASLAVRDTIQQGRPHRATMVAAACVIVSLGTLLAAVGTPTAAGLIESLSARPGLVGP